MKLRPFELGLVIIFILLGVAALLIVANYQAPPAPPPPGGAITGSVAIWGTLPQSAVDSVLDELEKENEQYRNVSYRYINPLDFDSRLVTALADRSGPDLILVSHERLVDMRNRIQPVSFESFPLRDVKDRYVDGAEIFALNDGLYAFPIAIDPLMMYWNRDILATNGFLEAPATWEALVNTQFPEIIEKDFSRTIKLSVVAMGEYANVRNAYGVISMLFIQSGSAGVIVDEDGRYSIQLQNRVGGGTDPLRSAVDFYTRFSKPSNTLYSWNRSLPEDRQSFVAEDLAMYFGFASEGEQIQRMNPNLNFDITEVPQSGSATVRRTYGKFYGLSVLNSSSNMSGAFAVLSNFRNQGTADQIAINSDMAPAYRTSLSAGSNDAYGRVAYMSAAVSRGWLNPDKDQTDAIFQTMTQDISENRRELSGAISDATERLEMAY
jgi:ABC-type glycerol-3-phosphate transport system substrate-binding protein